MDVKIGSRWESVVAELVASGRFASVEEIVNEGLGLVADRERAFRELKESLAAALEEEGELSDEDVAANVRARLEARGQLKAAE